MRGVAARLPALCRLLPHPDLLGHHLAKANSRHNLAGVARVGLEEVVVLLGRSVLRQGVAVSYGRGTFSTMAMRYRTFPLLVMVIPPPAPPLSTHRMTPVVMAVFHRMPPVRVNEPFMAMMPPVRVPEPRRAFVMMMRRPGMPPTRVVTRGRAVMPPTPWTPWRACATVLPVRALPMPRMPPVFM